jgi:hypothetical protein
MMFAIADRIGGVTVGELMQRMDCDEADHWLAYIKKHDDPKALRV